MAVSMTGYGQGTAESGGVKVHIEIKTVNHRFCEISTRMPRQLLSLEDKIKKTAAGFIKRGRAEVFISVEGSSQAGTLCLNWSLADQFFSRMEEAAARYSLPNTASLQDLLQLENIFYFEEEHTDSTGIELLLFQALSSSLEMLKDMRIREGEALSKDLAEQLRLFKERLPLVKEYAPDAVEHYRRRLYQVMAEAAGGKADENRLILEAAVFADKADINEEIARIESHLLQFEETLSEGGPIGRKLDFVVQELNREVNTIGAKANEPRITKEVVEMKSLLEKMKEQVQNIE